MKKDSSTVTEVRPMEPTEFGGKKMYVFEVSMENGDGGTMYKTGDNPYLSVGDQVAYTISDKGTFKVFREGSDFNGSKSSYSYSGNNDDTQKFIVRQCVLKCAVDLAIAEGKSSDEQAIMQRAERFEQWVFTKQISDNSKPLPF